MTANNPIVSDNPNRTLQARRSERSHGRAVARWFAAGALIAVAAGCGGADAAADPPPTTDLRAAPTTPAPTPAAAPSPEPAADSPTARVVVAGGEITSGRCRVEVELGDRVVIEVVSDEADELHIHGYDVTVQLVPDEPARAELEATIPGVFEAELHHSGLEACELRVQ